MKRKFLLLTLMCILGGLSSSLWAQFNVTYNPGTQEQYTLTFTPIEGFDCAVQMTSKDNAPKANTDLVIPATVEYQGNTYTVVKIPSNAFSGGSRYLDVAADYFTSLTIPGTVTTIGSTAFEWWSNCTTVTLGEGVTSISNNAFKNASAITTIYCYAETPPTCGGNSVFHSNVKNNATVYVPANSIDDYKKETTYGYGWAYIATNNFKAISTTPTAPGAPTLNSPANGASDIFNPNLNFTLGENTTHYQILMAEGAGTDVGDYTETSWFKKSSDNVSYQTSNLKSNTTYFWKVKARNGDDNDALTAESEPASFRTREVTAAPNEIKNATPKNNVEIAYSNPILEWVFAENTEDYQVVLDGDIKVDWTNKETSTTGSYQTSNLGAGTHTWQVNTRNSAGTTTGAEYSFIVIGAPGKVTPIFPLDEATDIAEATIKFRFAESTTHYRVLFATTDDPNPTHPYKFLPELTENDWVPVPTGVTEVEVEIPIELELNTKYYWTVEVKNGAGETKYFNYVKGEPIDWDLYGDPIKWEQIHTPQVDVYTFTSASVLAATNVAPADGSNNLENPELSWNFIGDATHYQVYIGTSENDLVGKGWEARRTEGTGLAGTGSYQTENLTAETLYFWRVDVKEGVDGEVLAGDVWSFGTTIEAPVAQADPTQVVPSLGDYGSTTINWSEIETAQGYNVYLGEEKLNAELITNPINYYEIPANSLKLNYNMNPGHDFYVEAVYGNGLGSVKSEAVNVKVTGTGYFTATIYKNDWQNRLEGATITLSRTKDEFGNVYEEGNGEQYEYTTNSLGQAYYESTTPDETVQQVTSIRIQNGTYNVTVSKDNYESYEGTITIDKGVTTSLSEILTADPTVIFDVTLSNISVNSVDVYLENNNWEDAQPGYYHVYLKNGEDIEDLGTQWFQAPNNMTTSVYITYTDWAYLGKGNYQFGVSKDDDIINWSAVQSINYDVFEGSEDTSWENASNWRDLELPKEDAEIYLLAPVTIEAEEEVIAGTINIQQGGSLTINGSLTAGKVYNNTQLSAMQINDGGQLHQSNESLRGRIVKELNRPSVWTSENIEGWQFISAPFVKGNDQTSTGVELAQFIPVNDAQGDYDLYMYDGDNDLWRNHKHVYGEGEEAYAFGEEFKLGTAYLASLELAERATFSGTFNAATSHEFNVSYNEEKRAANFHLLGNPFTFDINTANLQAAGLSTGYAVMNEAGDDYEYLTEGTIPVGDGFFVFATEGTASLSYAETRGAKEATDNINIVARGEAGSNNVIINFGEGEGFHKLEGFNKEVANIYVANAGNKYAIYNCESNVNEVELTFVAKQMGSYSLSFDLNGEFESVVLVDRLTGVETDMIAEGEYNFIASSEDMKNRFVVRFANGQEPTANASFVYQSGDELIIDTEGAIEIIDMMGRVVYSSEANVSRVNVSNFNNAAYVVRAINEGKVQKVVIY